MQLYWCTAAAAALVVLVSPQQHKQLGSAFRVQLPFVVPFMSLKETVVTAYDCMQARAMQQHAVYLCALCSLHALIAQLGRQHVSLANASYVRQTSVVSWNPIWSQGPKLYID